MGTALPEHNISEMLRPTAGLPAIGRSFDQITSKRINRGCSVPTYRDGASARNRH